MPDLEPNAAAAAAATATATMTTKMIDETYEFSAPRFYDFIKDESDDDKRQAELWFDAALPYAPSRTSSLIPNILFFFCLPLFL